MLAKRIACAHCGNPGKPRQLNDLQQFDKNEPVVVLCAGCVHSLRYADAKTWKWFRDYRDRLRRINS
jgi:RNase P subunit RPR2